MEKNTEFHEKNLLSIVTFVEWSIMLWSCMASTGTGKLVKLNSSMSPCKCQLILDNNVQESFTKLKLRQGWIS